MHRKLTIADRNSSSIDDDVTGGSEAQNDDSDVRDSSNGNIVEENFSELHRVDVGDLRK